jgi:hypothetical protein
MFTMQLYAAMHRNPGIARSSASARMRMSLQKILVPTGRLELPRVTPLPPQDSVSTNFTTSAFQGSEVRNQVSVASASSVAAHCARAASALNAPPPETPTILIPDI